MRVSNELRDSSVTPQNDKKGNMNCTEILNKLINKQDLTQKEASEFLIQLMDGVITPVQAAAILTALRIKGESVEEIVGLVKVMRKRMIVVEAGDVLDVCGTGGDGSNTFNVSTTASFVVAGCGVKVAKHGNKAASSLSGSADVLKELGVKIDLTKDQAEKVLEKVGMVFLMAPFFHPSMKQVGAVRAELKIRTVFNFLGPFANPAKTKKQLIGVPNLEIAQKMAKAATQLGYKHLIIATSEDGLDEVSINSKTHLFEVKGKIIKRKIIDPQKLGFRKVSHMQLVGSDAKANAVILKDILSGQKGPKTDLVVINAALALVVAGKAKTITQGIELAKVSIESGKARNILENLVRETQKYA